MTAGIREDGLLSYRNNGIDPRFLVSKRVQVGADRLTGCYGAAAALPCRKMYTPCEMASMTDMQGMRQMPHTFLNEKKYDEVNV